MQRDTQATHRESQVVEIRPEDITLEEEIGFGSFAKVYRGKCRGQMVAIKVLKTQTFTEDTLQAFREEVAVMSQIHHPNLVLFMGACTIPGKLMIVTELMPRNLESVFLSDKKPDKKRITLVQKLKMAKDAALGMNWLHKSTPMFIHRDLKLANLLVDENYNVKVCDFGLAKMKQANERLTADKKGSPLYMAPEVFSGSYSEKCDIYSFGLSFWEIINERRVFPRYENNLAALIRSRCGPSHETPPITEGMLPRLVALLQRCWNQNPTQRPSFDVVVKELEEIIIEQCISDEKGRDVWKKASKGEDKMLWDDFARAVCISVSKIGLPESYRSDRQIQCLKVLLCRQSEPNTVYAEKFGKVLSWFGPYLDQREEPHLRCRTFLDRIEETLSQKWFHGELSTQDAEERLGSRQKGTYLVRFSSAQGAFTVSGIDRSGNKCHLRVQYRPHKGEYVLPDGSDCATLTEAVNELCRRNKMRLPCPGSRYAKYFAEGQEPQPLSKNINLVKEEIKQMQLVHLMEIVDVTEEQSSVNASLDAAHRLMSNNPYNSGSLNSGNLSSVAFNSRGAFGGRGPAPFSQASPDALRIAPFIPPAASSGMSFGLTSPSASPRFPSMSSSSSTAMGGSGHRPNPAALAASKAATAVAAARAYHQSPYTHTSSAGGPKASSSSGNGGSGGGGGGGGGTSSLSAKFLNPPDLYYSAPMAGVKNNSGSVFPHSQFASPKHAFTKDVLTAPLKSQQDTKKRGLFSRLKRGVTGKDKDKDRDAHDGGSNSGGLDNGGGGGFDRDNSDASYDLSQTFAWGPGKSGKLNTKSSKRSASSKRDKRVNNNNGGARRGRREGDDSPDYPQYFSGSSDSDSPGHDWPRTIAYLPPMLPSESTSASTNSIPAHVLCSLQKSEDQRVRRMLAGRYDSDSSTEDLFPPYVPSASALAALTAAGTTVPASVAAAATPPTSASSAFVKRGTHTDERGRLGHRRPVRDDDNESEESEDEDGESEAEYGESEEDSGSEESDEEQLEKQKTKRKGTTTTTTSKSPTTTPAAGRLKAKESSRALKDDKAARRRRRVEESDDDEVDDDHVEEHVEDEQQKKRKTRKSEKGKERRKAAVKDVETDRRAAGKLARGAMPAAGGREMSLASTAPPGFFDSALFNPDRHMDRKAESRHARRAVNGINGVSDHANGGGGKPAEPEGVRLDQLVLPASSPLLPPPAEDDDDDDQEEEKKEEKKKKEKKRTTTRSKEDSGGDEGETTTMKTGSAPGKTTTKEKKSKKEKSSGKRGGSVVLAASTPDNNNGANSGSSRTEAAPLQRRSLASASASASSDLTGGEEDEMSEKEQNDPQGKKKKKDEERTVIAVF